MSHVREAGPRRFAPLPIGCVACLCPADLLSGTGLGELVVAGDGCGGIVIVRADPRIAIEGRLLRDWHDAAPPGFTLECTGLPGHAGDVIRAGAADQRVVYVVRGTADQVNDVLEACWPDLRRARCSTGPVPPRALHLPAHEVRPHPLNALSERGVVLRLHDA